MWGGSLAVGVTRRTRRLAAANLSEQVRAAAAARAGVEQLRGRLVRRLDAATSAPLDPWRGADSILVDTLAVGDARAIVRVHDVGTALHLNRATEDDLRRFFVALRVDAGDADRLAQAIADWREIGRAFV